MTSSTSFVVTLQEILDDLGSLLKSAPKSLALDTPVDVSKFHFDSRLVANGGIFVALPGARVDGHDFLTEEFRQKVLTFFYHSSKKDPAYGSKGIEVTDSLEAMLVLAKKHLARIRKDKKVFAITGSVGKTTCKNILKTILPDSSFASTKNYNTEIGLAYSIFQIKPEHQNIIFEMGARHDGDIFTLTQIAPPDVAALLNIRPVHLAEFGSIEMIRKTKYEIFSHPTTIAVLPSEEKGMPPNPRNPKVYFGTSGDVTFSQESPLTIKIRGMDQVKNFQTPIIDHSIPPNLAASCAMALAAGYPLSALKGLEQLHREPGRFEIITAADCTIVDDSYNAGRDSMRAGFLNLKDNFAGQKILCVLGDIFETADKEQEIHEGIGQDLQNILPDAALVAIGPLASRYYPKFKNSLQTFPSTEKALNSLKKLAQGYDILYFKASRGMHFETLIQNLLS